jgi:hypothetical protein
VTSALIGYTGFIGSHLTKSCHFDLLVNRANLGSLRGATLDRFVCAGLPSEKWLANQRPAEDAQNVRKLEEALSTVKARRAVLISTVDVYPCTEGVDETDACGQGPNHAYGTHRLQFEHFIQSSFPETSIVRLPAVFGRGLKKNVIHDLLHDHRLERVNPASRFQWYPLSRLPHDLQIVDSHGLQLVNLVTEPLETRTILEGLFGEKRVGQLPDARAHYDLRSCHGSLFGGDSRYILSKEPVMDALREFVDSERRRR